MRSSSQLGNDNTSSKSSIYAFLLQVWSYLRPHKIRFLFAIIAVLISSSVVLLFGQALRHFIDAGFGANGDEKSLMTASILLISLVVCLSLSSFFRSYLVSWLGERFVFKLRLDVVKNLLHQPPVFFETLSVGQTVSRLGHDLTLLQTVVSTMIPIAARNGIMVIGGFIFLFITSVDLAMIILLMVPMIFLVLTIFGKPVREHSRATQQYHGDCTDFIEESLYGLKTLQSYTQEERTQSTYNNLIQKLFTQAIRRNRIRSIMTSLIIFIVLSSVVAVLWIGGMHVRDGIISVGDLSAFLFYAVIMAGSLNAFSDIGGELQKATAAAERLFFLRDSVPDIKDVDAPLPFPDGNGDIIFSDITMSYPKFPDRNILQNLSLTIKRGQKIAIVGVSGAGKTSLFDLLLRFYIPNTGKITISGTNIAQISLNDLRKNITYLAQESFVLATSIAENINLGNIIDPEHMAQIADQVQLTSLINSHTEGLQTATGSRGLNLSGGQKQKVSLGRAILKNTDIILLDEPTASLDGLSESRFLEILKTDWINKTVIIAAHRLSTIQHVDRIVILDQGTIIASGNHRELYACCDLYKTLVDTQMMET